MRWPGHRPYGAQRATYDACNTRRLRSWPVARPRWKPPSVNVRWWWLPCFRPDLAGRKALGQGSLLQHRQYPGEEGAGSGADARRFHCHQGGRTGRIFIGAPRGARRDDPGFKPCGHDWDGEELSSVPRMRWWRCFLPGNPICGLNHLVREFIHDYKQRTGLCDNHMKGCVFLLAPGGGFIARALTWRGDNTPAAGAGRASLLK